MRVLEKTKHAGRSAANGGVTLELVNEAREREFLTLVRQSRQLHASWVRPPSTPAAFREYVVRLSQPTHAGYFVCDAGKNLVGVVNINEMVRGAMCSGALGYYAFAPSHAAGYMTRGLTLVIRRAFTRHGLHRLEANLQLENERSRN